MTYREPLLARFHRSLDRFAGYAFSLPALIIVVGLMLYPFLFALYLGFTEWDFRAGNWIGWENYQRLFSDRLFWRSLNNTIFYTAVNLTVGVALSISFALLMSRAGLFSTPFRAVIFLPVVISFPVAAMAWLWVLEPSYGLLNQTLEGFGLLREPIPWLTSPHFSKWSIAMVNIWKGTGLSAVILLAGLQNIPRDLYEAAELDGANAFRRLFAITLPLLRPVILVVMVIKGIGSFKTFDQVFIMTGGGPLYSTETILLYLYRNGFEYFDFGYASAIGMVFFLIVALLSAVQVFFLRNRQ